MTKKEAQNEVIYTINSDLRIEENNLYDFVMESAEKTTSPRGVEMKLHIRENQEEGTFDVYNWGFRGQNLTLVQSFDTEEEAEDFIFERTFQYDFIADDQRNTCYFYTKEHAIESLIEIMADKYGIYEYVAKSILRHQLKADELRVIKEKEHAKKIEEYNERVHQLVPIYAKLIEKKQESFKETCHRLNEAIGSRIENRIFFGAVKLIRSKID
jgi:hypothetical protein